MKRIATLAAVIGLAVTPALAQETLKFAHVYEANTLYNDAAEWIAREIEQRTDGKYKVDVFPSSQLGNEETITEGLQIGSIQMAYTGPTFLGQFYKPMAISEAPFIWESYDHWKKYQDSDIFQEVTQGYFDKTGNKVTSILYFGSRQTSSQEKIETPEDMKGMKIRVANAPLWKIFPTAAGANPTPISFAEVYLALQQGVVEGQENPITIIESNKFYEVQNYVARTSHITSSVVSVFGGPLWSKLTPEEQELFAEITREASVMFSDKIVAREEELFDKFRNGDDVEIVDVDRAPFAELVIPAVKAEWGEELVDRVTAIAD
ncbi:MULTISPECIES: DctP family TRAP transporter solute-binding subunit [Nitratireductor]|uniref:DctP family TRAP transporter solute-binding subunit n=1 Tax=Nitratireductor TaxID=245876 RepID=UPI0013AFABFA|nr:MULTISPECIES: DctP family TRAP transporter solute-binding subunit [Nitratireductor]MBN7776475.1 DctP family TRAP transporter solute-binding subunit [Nitratireductor pacificus]MBN7779342.1 DctP family TRAP transporter solute-binding subunit [Nitratireductor pacificus]MBN7788149.1 DctP family TRAP transporter solute-binding subunit [Nitratireductor aquimarinus]MBY6098196.1 DctP family TRAP transporter solute-binding subunit [Nitratireductor aquimarinus]MCA1259174.1 DctP family TRAP transporte